MVMPLRTVLPGALMRRGRHGWCVQFCGRPQPAPDRARPL